jgi:hypothetical protein
MVPGHVIEFTPADSAPAVRRISGMDGVLEVQTYGEKLHVFVDNVPRRKPEIEARLAADGIAHNELRPVEVRMEEAFISLVQRQNQLETNAQTQSHAALPVGGSR